MGFSFGVNELESTQGNPRDYAKLFEALHRPEAVNLIRNQVLARSPPHYGPLCITPRSTIVTPNDPQHGVIEASHSIGGDRSIALVNSVESLQQMLNQVVSPALHRPAS